MNTEARVDKLIWIKKVHMRDLKVSQWHFQFLFISTSPKSWVYKM
jgi:hypothetical protein